MQKFIKLRSNDEASALYGNLDQNIRQAEKDYRVRLIAKNDRLKIIGDKKNVESAFDFFQGLLEAVRKGGRVADRPAHEPHAPKDIKGEPPVKGGIHFFSPGQSCAGEK